MFDRKPKEERRKLPFVADQEKFSTQRAVTYIILGVFIGTAVQVLAFGTDQSERSMLLQTIINLTLLAVGFWIGSSKQSQDQTQASITRDTVPALAAVMPKVDQTPQKAEDVVINATGDVSVEQPKKE